MSAATRGGHGQTLMTSIEVHRELRSICSEDAGFNGERASGYHVVSHSDLTFKTLCSAAKKNVTTQNAVMVPASLCGNIYTATGSHNDLEFRVDVKIV